MIFKGDGLDIINFAKARSGFAPISIATHRSAHASRPFKNIKRASDTFAGSDGGHNAGFGSMRGVERFAHSIRPERLLQSSGKRCRGCQCVRCLGAAQPQKQAGSRRCAKGGNGGGCMPKTIMVTAHRGADAAANLISGDHRTQECFARQIIFLRNSKRCGNGCTARMKPTITENIVKFRCMGASTIQKGRSFDRRIITCWEHN